MIEREVEVLDGSVESELSGDWFVVLSLSMEVADGRACGHTGEIWSRHEARRSGHQFRPATRADLTLARLDGRRTPDD